MVANLPDFIRPREEITVDYEPGTTQTITLEDGAHVVLRKIDHDYDATDRNGALQAIHESRARGEFVTGLLYVDPGVPDLCEREKMTQTPLAQLAEKDLRIAREDWDKIMAV
jgi:2-oxoglutarate ferredoxin oxidoreductase subunit beta